MKLQHSALLPLALLLVGVATAHPAAAAPSPPPLQNHPAASLDLRSSGNTTMSCGGGMGDLCGSMCSCAEEAAAAEPNCHSDPTSKCAIMCKCEPTAGLLLRRRMV